MDIEYEEIFRNDDDTCQQIISKTTNLCNPVFKLETNWPFSNRHEVTFLDTKMINAMVKAMEG